MTSEGTAMRARTPTGELRWVRQAGSDLDDEGWDVAVDAAGHVHVSGGTMGTVGGTRSEVPGASLSSDAFDFPDHIIGESGTLHPMRRVSAREVVEQETP